MDGNYSRFVICLMSPIKAKLARGQMFATACTVLLFMSGYLMNIDCILGKNKYIYPVAVLSSLTKKTVKFDLITIIKKLMKF